MATAFNPAALDPAILSLLASSYGKPAEQVVAAAVKRADKASKPAKPSKLAARKAAEQDTPDAPKAPAAFLLPDLPPAGSISAAVFMRKLRALGPLFVAGTEITHDVAPFVERNAASFVTRRNAAIVLIAGYCGFDRYADFGEQEFTARMRATRELAARTVAFPAEQAPHSVHATVSGYVAGMPDTERRRMLDLAGRERVAAEALSACECIAKGEGTDEQVALVCERFNLDADMVRSQALVLAGIEEKRLAQIRADLGVK